MPFIVADMRFLKDLYVLAVVREWGMSLVVFYRIAFLLVLEALLAWFISLLLLTIGQPASSYAIYGMIVSTLLSAAAILLVGFAHLFSASDK